MDITPCPGGTGRAVLARDILQAGPDHRSIRWGAPRRERAAARRGGVAVETRRRATLVGNRRGSAADGRGAVRRALLRSRHRAAGERGQPGAVVVMAGRARGDGDGVDSACRRVGPWCRGATARVVGDSGRVCLGCVGGDRWPLVVGPAWGMAGVVHVFVAARAHRCDSAGAAALGARRHGDRRGHGGRAARVGCGGRRSAVPRESRCVATGT